MDDVTFGRNGHDGDERRGDTGAESNVYEWLFILKHFVVQQRVTVYSAYCIKLFWCEPEDHAHLSCTTIWQTEIVDCDWSGVGSRDVPQNKVWLHTNPFLF